MIEIPIPPDSAHFTQRTELDGTPYALEFLWNARLGAWTLSLSTPDGDPIVSGIVIVSDWPLLRRYKYDPRVPRGELFAYDPTKVRSTPGYIDLGTLVPLYYFTAEEA